TATDVYALGVLLYEVVAGCRPAPAGEQGGPPQRPSTQVTEAAAALRDGSRERVRRTLRGDLDTIVLKALHPEPERRYGSAQAFGDDLQHWLDGQPVRARPDGAWYRTRRFVSRHRWGTLAAAVVVMSLVTGASIAVWQAHEAQRQALEAGKQAQRAEQARNFLVRIVSQTNPRNWRDGKEPSMGEVLDAGAGMVDEELATTPELHAEMLA